MQGPVLCEAGVVRSKRNGSLESRLGEIHHGILEVVNLFSPSVMAIEQLYSHYARPRTAILMGHARGVVCLAASIHGLSVEHYPATRVKKVLTGNGHAGKVQVQKAILRELKLPSLPGPLDVSDAIAVAICHYYLSRRTNPI